MKRTVATVGLVCALMIGCMTLIMLMALAVPVFAVNKESDSNSEAEVQEEILESASEFAYLDADKATPELKEKILEARKEIIYNTDWVADGYVGCIRNIKTGKLIKELPEFSEVFPGWDVPIEENNAKIEISEPVLPAVPADNTMEEIKPLLMTSALAVDSEDTMEKTTTADKEQKALRLNDVVSTDDYKENIFNSILNSVDYYDAVEGSFVTTLWREDGEPTVVSYGSDINAQKSYQEISAEDEEYQVLVADGEKYTINAKARTRKVENVGYEEVSSRIKQTGSIYAASVAYETADNSDASAARVGTEDGVPVYYYRNDLTNCDYAAVSIFPQTLAFGLLTNLNDWEVVSTDTYLDRNVLIVEGTISDPIYSQKINSETFKLVVDAETGIVLEFVGYDDLGNETESIKTTDISIIKNTNGGSTDIAAFVDASLDNREVYKDTERTNFLDTDYGLSISAASFIDIDVSNPNSDLEMKTFSLSVSPTIFD